MKIYVDIVWLFCIRGRGGGRFFVHTHTRALTHTRLEQYKQYVFSHIWVFNWNKLITCQKNDLIIKTFTVDTISVAYLIMFYGMRMSDVENGNRWSDFEHNRVIREADFVDIDSMLFQCCTGYELRHLLATCFVMNIDILWCLSIWLY